MTQLRDREMLSPDVADFDLWKREGVSRKSVLSSSPLSLPHGQSRDAVSSYKIEQPDIFGD